MARFLFVLTSIFFVLSTFTSSFLRFSASTYVHVSYFPRLLVHTRKSETIRKKKVSKFLAQVLVCTVVHFCFGQVLFFFSKNRCTWSNTLSVDFCHGSRVCIYVEIRRKPKILSLLRKQFIWTSLPDCLRFLGISTFKRSKSKEPSHFLRISLRIVSDFPGKHYRGTKMNVRLFGPKTRRSTLRGLFTFWEPVFYWT